MLASVGEPIVSAIWSMRRLEMRVSVGAHPRQPPPRQPPTKPRHDRPHNNAEQKHAPDTWSVSTLCGATQTTSGPKGKARTRLRIDDKHTLCELVAFDVHLVQGT